MYFIRKFEEMVKILLNILKFKYKACNKYSIILNSYKIRY